MTPRPILRTLLRERDALTREYQHELKLLDQLIAAARSHAPASDRYKAGIVFGEGMQPFRGLGKPVALRAYLNMVGGSARMEDAVRDLLAGGADLGQPDRHQRTLKIIATNNRKLFRYDARRDTIALIKR